MNKILCLHASMEVQVLETSKAAEPGVSFSIVIDFLIIRHEKLIFRFILFIVFSFSVALSEKYISKTVALTTSFFPAHAVKCNV